MSIDARLQKATQGLSGRQRAVLVLRAQSEGREADPAVSQNIPDEQERRIYNRYIALAHVINRELGALGHTLNSLTMVFDHCAAQVRLLGQAAGLIAEQEGLTQAKKSPRNWRTTKEMPGSEFLQSLAREVRTDLRDGIALRQRELRALEAVWAELAEEFDGADPVHPDLRRQAAETAARLRALAEEMGERRRPAEPDERAIEDVRQLVDEAFRNLGPLL